MNKGDISFLGFQKQEGFSEKLFFYLLTFFLIFYVKDNAFFWDTVQLGSLHAHFYFENNFKSFLLPAEMDSGHPPFFGMYLAACWQLFGKSLAVSHFAMLPFVLGSVMLLFEIGKYFFNQKKWILVFVTLIFIDPCWIGQAALVSPDVVLVFSFLLAFVGILLERKWFLVFGILGLCLISTRGMMVAAAIFLFDLFNFFYLRKIKFTIPKAFSKTIPYWFGGFSGIAFLLYHYVATGWIGYHEGSPWAPLFAKVGWEGMLRNVGILGWRILDFGRVFLVLILLLGTWTFFTKKIKLDLKIKQLLTLLIMLIFFLTPSFILHKDLSGHRYLLPLFLVIDMLALYVVFLFFVKKRIHKVLIVIALLGLGTGNLWIYPKTIAQGWDSALAHLPYFELRKNMISYLDEQQIPIGSVGSVYPNLATFELIDLNGRGEQFSEKDLEVQEYVFYSNVFNDFSDDEIVLLENEWEVEKEFRKRGICVILYRKN